MSHTTEAVPPSGPSPSRTALDNDLIVDRVLRSEGGYVDHPADAGGPTNFGITLATLTAWRGQAVDARDVRRLTRAEARAIYLRRYLEEPGFGAVEDGGLRMILVDCAVLYGPRRAVLWLQAALCVSEDGLFGPATLSALRRGDPGELARAILDRRRQRIAARCAADSSQRVFQRGWTARTDALAAFC